MKNKGEKHEEKQVYVKPKVIATYNKKELLETIQGYPSGSDFSSGTGSPGTNSLFSFESPPLIV